jgi:hypothetical protein
VFGLVLDVCELLLELVPGLAVVVQTVDAALDDANLSFLL